LGDFNNLLKELAQNKTFINLISINSKLENEMYLEELILRFFVFKFEYKNFQVKHSIEEFLDNFMEEIYLNKILLDLVKEKDDFIKVINFLSQNDFTTQIFKAKNYQFNANLYDSIMFVAHKFILKDDKTYQEVSGHKTNSIQRMSKKIERAIEIFDV